jgi:hypothetical protein
MLENLLHYLVNDKVFKEEGAVKHRNSCVSFYNFSLGRWYRVEVNKALYPSPVCERQIHGSRQIRNRKGFTERYIHYSSADINSYFD